MAIMTKPCEIFNLIIFPVLVYVVRCEHPFISKFTPLAYRRNAMPLKYAPVCIQPVYPICMFRPNKLCIPPGCLAGLATEKLFTF